MPFQPSLQNTFYVIRHRFFDPEHSGVGKDAPEGRRSRGVRGKSRAARIRHASSLQDGFKLAANLKAARCKPATTRWTRIQRLIGSSTPWGQDRPCCGPIRLGAQSQ